MTTIRTLVSTAIATVTAVLLSLVTASAALAQVPRPDPVSGSSGAPATAPTAADGVGAWEVVAISAACALVAILITLAVSHLVRSHGHRPRFATA